DPPIREAVPGSAQSAEAGLRRAAGRPATTGRRRRQGGRPWRV
ncbi:MAG: hypothetical protein AVDCRST_MAG67-2438, partial [uncultured Solirubrobacteraceae bacterium]